MSTADNVCRARGARTYLLSSWWLAAAESELKNPTSNEEAPCETHAQRSLSLPGSCCPPSNKAWPLSALDSVEQCVDTALRHPPDRRSFQQQQQLLQIVSRNSVVYPRRRRRRRQQRRRISSIEWFRVTPDNTTLAFWRDCVTKIFTRNYRRRPSPLLECQRGFIYDPRSAGLPSATVSAYCPRATPMCLPGIMRLRTLIVKWDGRVGTGQSGGSVLSAVECQL